MQLFKFVNIFSEHTGDLIFKVAMFTKQFWLQEEEDKLLSGPKEEYQVSEASLRAVQEEEEKLILQKVPLQKKMAEIS